MPQDPQTSHLWLPAGTYHYLTAINNLPQALPHWTFNLKILKTSQNTANS